MFVMLVVIAVVVGVVAALPKLDANELKVALSEADCKMVLIFTSEWCFKSMAAVEFIDKVAHKHAGVRFAQTDSQQLAQ